MTPRFSVGNEVRLVSQPDRAGKITAVPQLLQGEYWYSIYFGPGQSSRHPEADLESYVATVDVRQMLRDGRFAGREAFSKRVTYLKLARALTSHVYALQASRTTFYAYQFKPVLKFLDSWKHRILIADEVGLGKTIEAGLVLTELRARVDLARVLIVAPAHLLTKWEEEMRRRFALPFQVLDRRGAIAFLDAFERDAENTRLFGLISLQTLRGRGLQDRWAAVAPTFDAVVFDEAGRLRNADTLSHRAAQSVAEGADAMLLLTATPVQTGERDLFSLLALLDPEEFSDFASYQLRLKANRSVLEAMRFVRGGASQFPQALALLEELASTQFGRGLGRNALFMDVARRLGSGNTQSRADLVELQRDLNAFNLFGHVLSRTRRSEVDEARALRSPVTVSCGPTEAEGAFYRLVTELCRRNAAGASGNAVSAFATMMPQRMMASCMPAMAVYAAERIESGGWGVRDPEMSDLRLEDWDENSDGDTAPQLSWSALGDLRKIGQALEKADSKWANLLSVLSSLQEQQPGAKVVIFSFFKRTLAYLERRLTEQGIESVVISGDVKSDANDIEQDERGRRLGRFKADPSVRVLLSTEVGNEGLDLQFCHVLVNYDLPWNPMVVEQRIGRLDRIGQKASRIQIYNLSMPGTIEDLVLQRLYARVKIFENSIGDLEEILGEVVRELTLDLLSAELTEAEMERRIVQAADVVERKRLEQAALEDRVASLIGHDEFFADEIARVRHSRRYVTGDELLLFVADYLSAHHPSCRLVEEDAGLWTLTVNEQLRWFVRGRLGAEEGGWLQFQKRSGRGVLRITTDTALSQDRPDVDLLTFHHPLIQAIGKHYSEQSGELHPVSWISLVTEIVPVARYLWLLYAAEITGARSGRDIAFVAVDEASGHPLDPDACDSLLWEMVANGRSQPHAGRPPEAAHLERLIDVGDATAAERLNARFEQHRRLNDAMVTARLASLDEAHRRNRLAREGRLQMARARDRAPHYLRMLEGSLRNLVSSYEVRRREVEAQARLGRSLNIEGAGFVEVRRG